MPNTPSTISIMADFGMGPYAWLRNPEQSPPLVGSNIADSVSGFPEEYNVSSALERDFANWVTEFERDYDKPEFDWENWNKVGISLTQRLKAEIGDRFLLEYHYPFKDPRFANVIRLSSGLNANKLEH